MKPIENLKVGDWVLVNGGACFHAEPKVVQLRFLVGNEFNGWDQFKANESNLSYWNDGDNSSYSIRRKIIAYVSGWDYYAIEKSTTAKTNMFNL